MSRGRPVHRPAITFNKEALTSAAGGGKRTSLVDRIFDRIVAEIQLGRLAPAKRIHSVRQLADECEVSRDTVARAYDKLVAHGYLESRAGSGFFVRAQRRPVQVPIEIGALPTLPAWWRFQLVQPAGNLSSMPGLGLLPSDWLDETGLAKAMRSVARGSMRSLTGYGDPLGYLPLRQQLQAKLRDLHIDAPVARIMVTAGATHALHLIVLAWLRTPGEHVLVEDPCSFLLRDRLLASGLEMLKVPREADGPNLDVLRDYCMQYRPRFFFCNSVLHNPTSGHISPHKAFQILRLAEEFDLIIVEDDTYSDLMPPGATTPATRLASLDQLQRVIYIGSFSKTIAPGLRVGYMCANAKILDWLQVYRTVSEIAAQSVGERVIYQLLSQGSYRHHCAQLRSRLDECRQPVIESLGALGCTVDLDTSVGMYVWATLPHDLDAMPVADELLKQGHLLAPGVLFSPERHAASKMRFNVSRTLASPALPALERLIKARASAG
ncbi:DNA-binding transcriptional regulator, MocR family, contains an aminotransferase domain [Janthinobacterium sp. OK676]|uniref:aminotransferase-like domain-containing protein n=1 Tax=unclassified Janthinobacterium TaxID=2610881 RepID=UPI000883C903|nr:MULTISPECIES: PLP-dependent aminotransferase family protein [unclassified Janthinobacterium]PKB13807.1 GntR family transcriptional regulator [Janthinobacterium sp. 64]SDN22266.1 DNA-binding transcriptional regulator, MocR family, contains an aminotransferase domain [Janthinobacterium sp. OK676]